MMATTATSAAAASSLFPRNPFLLPPPALAAAAPAAGLPAAAAAKSRRQRGLSCHVALTTDDASAAAVSLSEEELAAAEKVGRRVRVKVPLRVYHVPKAPDLDLMGLEGTIKQYVGLWKGKRISANLPFKVEFHVAVEGQPSPVRLFAHLKEDEFEYL
ncbi:ferredoxin-thioredoxin reductase, variable chain-like [Iris pallida]|uniref:Ferredoxin-thioredoxin reductase, variable chain-like n=1 Tax=Iris pallida TaxID=29817 RepID=A0AAX6G1X7_IRIPA|nr:ferredoxin-thioredoxin reductase, variable chain-like [Iris pallida]KAJ6822630.1 ferredoxin-thioredoxin reductase, variable chain-like [Iris pallida]